MRFPSIKDVSASLRHVNAHLRSDGNDYSGDEGACDIHLQVYPDGAWALRVGASDYDQDHRGYWGCACLDGTRFDSRGMARDLIDQCREMRAQGDD